MKALFSILLVIMFLVLGCRTSSNQNLKKVVYTSDFQVASSSKPFEKKTYILMIPKGFSVENEDFNPEYKEVVYIYKNGTKVYITDNTMGGSALNGDNKLNGRISAIKRQSLQDSVYMGGQQKNGLYWKEYILNDVVIGYVNVPESRKFEFDQALLTLRQKGIKTTAGQGQRDTGNKI